MEPTEYEQAWAEGDETVAPAENAAKKAAEAAAEAQAREFSEAFFAGEPGVAADRDEESARDKLDEGEERADFETDKAGA